MLTVPPSIVSSSCWFSCSLVAGHSDDCASETVPWRGWENTPSLLTGTDMFACIGSTGRGIPLLAKSGCLSAVFPTISRLRSWSIIFWAPLSIVGEILMLLSSYFPGNGNAGPEPFFSAGGWPTKFWTRQWLFLCNIVAGKHSISINQQKHENLNILFNKFTHGINFDGSWLQPWYEPSYFCTFSCKYWTYSITCRETW